MPLQRVDAPSRSRSDPGRQWTRPALSLGVRITIVKRVGVRCVSNEEHTARRSRTVEQNHFDIGRKSVDGWRMACRAAHTPTTLFGWHLIKRGPRAGVARRIAPHFEEGGWSDAALRQKNLCGGGNLGCQQLLRRRIRIGRLIATSSGYRGLHPASAHRPLW